MATETGARVNLGVGLGIPHFPGERRLTLPVAEASAQFDGALKQSLPAWQNMLELGMIPTARLVFTGEGTEPHS